MHQRTIGEILAEERTKHHISIPKLAAKTRIRQSYIVALEENRFDELPAAVFVKGYIKTFGRVLGFDDRPLLALLRRDFKESSEGTLIPREFIAPALKRFRQPRAITTAIILLVVLFGTLFSYVLFQWFQLQRPPEITLISPADASVVGPTVVVRGVTDFDAVLTVNSQPVALQPDGSFETAVQFVTEGVVTVVVEAQDKQGKKSTEVRQLQVQF
ncbi:MAG: hypothetical protein COU65_01310 [Candidatus Pacebacteria bacterium CG10_big_fil_rev_8_21_14_0_10_42_12]|nr:helix-turn-helix domain-containing protein [Candidatus Paceibacterota bacterium]PIR62842.1 MAG: hypothetical protein COU65_01310 [Candidatus Pacebacteria bacterium CG10_big_fil_rev_8_21_14_0_10_42_12]